MTTLLPLFVVVLAAITSVASSGHNSGLRRHHQLRNRLSSPDLSITPNLPRALSSPLRKRLSCLAKPVNGTSTTSAPPKTTSTTTSSTSTKISTSVKTTPTPAKAPAKAASPVANTSNGNSLKPANWPTATQAGAAPAATRTSPADPFLLELSKSYNNANNDLYNQVHTGQMTFYGQGLGACGDTYDDNSFTAAVSKLMYDSWPGVIANQMNRAPICGPFVPGRKIINSAGQFETAVPGAQWVNVGGDGLLNCDTQSQCHIPLTATVKHGDKSIQVKIVDRCEACAIGDIDLTPAAFAALADRSLGRTSVTWFFNKY